MDDFAGRETGLFKPVSANDRLPGYLIYGEMGTGGILVLLTLSKSKIFIFSCFGPDDPQQIEDFYLLLFWA